MIYSLLNLVQIVRNFQSETSIGFQRPMEEPLKGSLEPYERHLFVATQQDASAWPARVETMEGSLPALLQKFFKGQEHPKIKGTKLAAIERTQHIGKPTTLKS